MVRDKQWFADQRVLLDHANWSIEMEESDPLFEMKINKVLDFLEENRVGTGDYQIFYRVVQLLYKSLTDHGELRLPKLLDFEKRMN